MSAATFTPSQWVKLSRRLSLEEAERFTADLVEQGLAEPAGRRYRLTDAGRGCLRALVEIPVYEDEVAA